VTYFYSKTNIKFVSAKESNEKHINIETSKEKCIKQMQQYGTTKSAEKNS
jgi:hypothetical protein